MTMAGPVSAYRAASISAMNRGQLLLAMYEGALGFLKQAAAAHERGDLHRFSYSLRRAQDIVAELLSTLDPKPAPQLAARLEGLYDFMLFQLTEANVHQASEPVHHVIRLLTRTYDAYRQIILNPSPEVQEILAEGAVAG